MDRSTFLSLVIGIVAPIAVCHTVRWHMRGQLRRQIQLARLILQDLRTEGGSSHAERIRSVLAEAGGGFSVRLREDEIYYSPDPSRRIRLRDRGSTNSTTPVLGCIGLPFCWLAVLAIQATLADPTSVDAGVVLAASAWATVWYAALFSVRTVDSLKGASLDLDRALEQIEAWHRSQEASCAAKGLPGHGH